MSGVRKVVPVMVLGALAARSGFRRLVAGGLVVDLDLGRSTRPLGPITVTIDAPREVVWEVIAAPYIGRQPAEMQGKIDIIERGADMVLAAHHTPVNDRSVATTLETVRFDAESHVVPFRLMRGPVPHVAETFTLEDLGESTRLVYDGELGTDLWALGRWWGDVVARRWEDAVRSSLAQIQQRAEGRAARRRARSS